MYKLLSIEKQHNKMMTLRSIRVYNHFCLWFVQIKIFKQEVMCKFLLFCIYLNKIIRSVFFQIARFETFFKRIIIWREKI